MLIQAALNGGRTRAEHPGIPISPDELAVSARASVAAGAGAIHFHVRGPDGRESLDPDDVARAVTAVRSAVPGTPVGVSTAAWILRDVTLRHEITSRWKVLPDFASVNFKEEGAPALADLLRSRGIGVEAGLCDAEGAEIFVKSELAPNCLRLLLEPFEQTTAAALKTLEDILRLLDPANARLPLVFHGVNHTAWVLIDVAAARGYDTRVGFEDILTLPDGQQAPGNGALVSETVRRTQTNIFHDFTA
jgi:uncharacterized protein (DUF849 family)